MVLRKAAAILAVISSVSASSSASEYGLDLSGIFVSHGVLSPVFNPKVYDYTLALTHAADHISIIPLVDQSRSEYATAGFPSILLDWPGRGPSEVEMSSVAIRREIDLPDQGQTLVVSIRVSNPSNPSNYLNYSVTVYQSTTDPVILLKAFEAVDAKGLPVITHPEIVSEDTYLYDLFVDPASHFVTIKPKCAQGNWVTVNGSGATNGGDISVTRELDHHRQLVEIACGKGSHPTKRYLFSIYSDYPVDQIKAPRLTVTDRGLDCTVGTGYNCPNPLTKDYRTRVVAYVPEDIRYTLESSDKSIHVRLLNEIPSIPFNYGAGSDMHVVAVAGRFNATWPLEFTGAGSPGPLRISGLLMGLVLAVLLLSLLIVLGIANTMGIGTPIGVSEIATAMTLLLQFFCFASALRGPNAWTNLTESMKWITLFWPLPWTYNSEQGLSLARFGDLADLQNAYGCIFWCGAILLSITFVHFAVMCSFKNVNTFPHRLRLGGWENRITHWLSFPFMSAVGMILLHSESSVASKCAAGTLGVLVLGWALGCWYNVASAIHARHVIWVWQSSVREEGELEDESGYWGDVICDQLLSQPVNRSLCQWFFPWKWVSTVGDIDRVDICPRVQEIATSVFPVDQYHRSHQESAYPLGKNPKTVDVTRTVAPSRLCPGQRLIAGLLRTKWIDLLFTFNGLSTFHTNVSNDVSNDFSVPLTVKTCQLTGPYTGGVSHFFYDGTRIPFIRIADSIFRILIGLLMGFSLASEKFQVDAGLFAGVSVLCVAFLIYHVVTVPYARKMENWIIATLLGAIGSTSLSYMMYAMSSSRPSRWADIFLWLTAGTSLTLAVYGCIVIFAIYTAVTCPPLEETRFLELLANCNVTISDHEKAWAVDIPAYNKNGARDLKAQCSLAGSKVFVSIYPSGEEPTVEFDSHEIFEACSTGSLPLPVLSVFLPDSTCILGYRHMNVYQRSNVQTELASFLSIDAKLRHLADNVSRHITHHVENRSRDKMVACITIVPPRTGGSNSIDDDEDERYVGRRSVAGSGSAKRRSPHGDSYSAIQMAVRR